MERVGVGYLERLDPGEEASFSFAPTREGVPSWNALATSGALRLRLRRNGEPMMPWLPYAEWNERDRTSFSAHTEGMRVEVDVVRADEPFDGIDLRGEGIDFSLLAFATRIEPCPSLPYARGAFVLDVPARSQYVVASEKGWCSAASLSMIHAFHGIDVDTRQTATEIYDMGWEGTGNWAFNVAFSGRLGLRGVVAYLDGLDRAQRLIERNIPLALSYRWRIGELPGAPLDHSGGHLVVLCGFASNGDCVINDPAHPDVRVIYPRAAIERIWQRGGGVAYVIAPNGIPYADILASA